MQKLHLVGFTTDHEGLILSARRGSRSGGYLLAVDAAVEEAVEALRARRAEEPGDDDVIDAPRVPRVESTLPVREIQARLRQGRSIADVAKAAGVDVAWVERFAPPILAERAQMISRVQSAPLRRPRLGPSALPIGEAVRHHLADRAVVLSPEEFASAWTARQLANGRWAVRFTFHYRGRNTVLRFDLDESSGEVTAADRQSGQLGYVMPIASAGRARRSPTRSAPARGAVSRPVVSTGFRADPTPAKAVSRSAKERERAAAAMRKAAAQRAAEAERAAARRARERAAEASRAERAAKAAAAKKQAAERARAREAAIKERRLAAERRAAEKKRVQEKAAAEKKAVANKPVAKKAVAKKVVAKKVVAKKAAVNKPVAKKVVANKPVANKPVAKKPVANKAVAKKTTVTTTAVTTMVAKTPAPRPVAPRPVAASPVSAAEAPAVPTVASSSLRPRVAPPPVGSPIRHAAPGAPAHAAPRPSGSDRVAAPASTPPTDPTRPLFNIVSPPAAVDRPSFRQGAAESVGDGAANRPVPPPAATPDRSSNGPDPSSRPRLRLGRPRRTRPLRAT